MQGILFEISCFQINQLKEKKRKKTEIKKQEEKIRKDERYKENELVKHSVSSVKLRIQAICILNDRGISHGV